MERFPVLLAGGLGTRLWPLSREIYPKQLMNLSGDGSFLQQAARRAVKVAPAKQIITVTTEALYRPIRDQLTEIDPVIADNILVEPEGRNTTAAIAMSALYAKERDKNAVLLVTPADHAIQDEKTIFQAFETAVDVANLGGLVTFGIKPTRPETGFGYIQRGQKIETADGVFEVKSFTREAKPHCCARLVYRSRCILEQWYFCIFGKNDLG